MTRANPLVFRVAMSFPSLTDTRNVSCRGIPI
ncbi:hypothetical protein AGR7B_Lc30020 [Agrobacterium deltaense RV3]|nr:hypothetical protein AGR7B_Lc30020 [Agrobacterium deltaense RV3]